MDLSLCTHVLVADLWDDPRLFYLVRGHIGHLCAVRICGLLVSQSLCPRTLFIGGISLLIALLIMMSRVSRPPMFNRHFRDFVPTAEIDREIAAYRGTWSDVQNARLIEALDIQFAGIPFFLFWRAGGLMLIGMALFKLGVFSATRSIKFYTRLVGVSGLISFPLVACSTVQLIGHDWDPSFRLLQHRGVYNYVGSIGVALFYVGYIMLISRTWIWHTMQARLAAVGRMAFTNYILQFVIATGLFYRYGFGLFGSVERWGQFLIVLIIWAFQLWISPIWLSKFRFGPLEWLGRSLTYFKFQTMLK